MEVIAGVAQVDRDGAVLGLADDAAPLPLHAGGLVPLLDVAGLVEDPDDLRPGVVGADESLQPVAHPVLIPLQLAEELLQGPGRHAGLDGDGLDALAGQVGELPGDVDGQVSAGILALEAVIEEAQELGQFGLQPSQLLVSMVILLRISSLSIFSSIREDQTRPI